LIELRGNDIWGRIEKMAQTAHIAPRTREFYKKTVGRLGITKPLRTALETSVSAYAALRHFSFPAKFNWEWKLEMLLEEYEKETTLFFKSQVHKNMHIVDIGAHIGYFTRLFSNAVGNRGVVYAFEADADNFALLAKNTAGRDNVMRLPVAIGNTEGTIDFYHLSGSTGCHSTVEPNVPAEKVTVPLTTLDAALEKLGSPPIDLIKMDIEGGEPNALAGMQKMLNENLDIMLVTEYNPSALGSASITYLEAIESLGFSLYAITKANLVPTSARTIDEQLAEFHRTSYINVLCIRPATFEKKGLNHEKT
jgi:FkbM family methyltransferase